MATANKRRDRHEIVADILNSARKGEIKTHIMYKAKLSYTQMSDYVDLLVKKGFLENIAVREKRQTITISRTTEKGIELLNYLQTINKLWK